MKQTMTSYERMKCMFEHREADRIPIHDTPWNTTVMRWEKEGLPTGIDVYEYLGMDRVHMIGLDASPRLPYQMLEKTDEYEIVKDTWGTTLKNFHSTQSIPEYIAFDTMNREDWSRIKDRFIPSSDRVDMDALKKNYRRLREEGYWIQFGLWFGTQAVNSMALGAEKFLMMLADDPEWIREMIDTLCTLNLEMADYLWSEGYQFDALIWADDIGFKHRPFMSPRMYREIVMPAHKRAVDWAHSHGIKAQMHSCGFIEPLLPDIIGIGVDSLNPIEVKAGMDPVKLKKLYGDKLVFHGGIDALLYAKPESFLAEMEKIIPPMKEKGGYIFATDHSIPDCVSLEFIQTVIARAKELGRYS